MRRRYHPPHDYYDAVMDRAIALLLAGEIDGRTVDEIRRGEKSTRNYCARLAVSRGIDEVRAAEEDRFADRRRVVLRAAEQNRAIKDIVKFVTSHGPSNCDPYEPVEDEQVTGKLLADVLARINATPLLAAPRVVPFGD